MFVRNKEMSNIPLFQELLMSDAHQIRNCILLCVGGQCLKLGGLGFFLLFLTDLDADTTIGPLLLQLI